METLKKIDAFLAGMEYQLNVTVFAILMAWTIGFVMPAVFLL